MEILRRRNKQVKVLDIGTGSGLLSMMAASAGADSITACEVSYCLSIQRLYKTTLKFSMRSLFS